MEEDQDFFNRKRIIRRRIIAFIKGEKITNYSDLINALLIAENKAVKNEDKKFLYDLE